MLLFYASVKETVICRVTIIKMIHIFQQKKMATGQLQTGIPPLTQAPPTMSQVDREKIYQWIIELTNPETRENALQELRYAQIVFRIKTKIEIII